MDLELQLQLESGFPLNCDLLDPEMRAKIGWLICVSVGVCEPECDLPVVHVCLWV